ncbi:Mtch-1p [Parelaphostrongylus tenuis]|uniref:Mtch-1p n=1 Tax=Parelaphostrongylus tenuis TaxID=148309 RepID=A0AAD5QXJ3_PARTN|nr:Mtch-1p [Parelaphostrongylus tenuis]
MFFISRNFQYIDTYYPEIGGVPENENLEERFITNHQSMKRHLRQAIRESVVRVVTVTIARPLAVAMIRQIAQLIGNEAKYSGTLRTMHIIGIEEGPPGLFSGLVPQMVGEVIVIFGTAALVFAAERAFVHSGMYEKKDEKSVKEVEDLRKFTNLAIPFVVNAFGYPYNVVSTVMAVAGSGLAVSFLPYAPTFVNWHSAWDYLTPFGLKRGARLFLREQCGAVSVGVDQQLYANNTHFTKL